MAGRLVRARVTEAGPGTAVGRLKFALASKLNLPAEVKVTVSTSVSENGLTDVKAPLDEPPLVVTSPVEVTVGDDTTGTVVYWVLV